MRQREDSPTDWKNQDAEMPVDGWIPPLTGCFAPLKGLLPGKFPQSLEESGLRSVRQREDSPTDWMFCPLKGPLPGRSLHRLDVFGLWDAYKREDSSTEWRNQDAGEPCR